MGGEALRSGGSLHHPGDGWSGAQRYLGLCRHGSELSVAPSCRKCGPRLSAEAAEKLKNRYIIMRSGARQHERDSDRRSSIPITVR